MHCASHRLNLVLASVAEIDPGIKSFFDTMDLVTIAIISVFVHEMNRRGQVPTVISNPGLFLVFFARLYDYTDVVTKGLQNQHTNVETVITLLDIVKDQTDAFDTRAVVDYALELSTKYDITDFDTRPSGRARKLPTKLEGTLVTGSVGHNSAATVEDLYVLLRQVVGHIRGELNARFGKRPCAVMRAAAVCTTSSPNFMDVGRLKMLEPIFDIYVKENEIEIFKNYILKNNTGEHCDLGLAEVYQLCDDDIFPSLHNALQLLLTIPQTSVTVERLFSSVKRIKSRLRSLMTTTRLTSLCLLSFEKDMLRTIDRERILSHFKSCKNIRLL